MSLAICYENYRHTGPKPIIQPYRSQITNSVAATRYGVRSYSPSFRLSQPSFRRKPESMACDHIPRHSGSPQPSFRLSQPSFWSKPESMACGHIPRHPGSPNRHSGLRRNLCPPTPLPSPPTVIPALPTVIPAKAGIYARRPITDSPNRHTDSLNRHSGESRNLCLPAPLPTPSTVIPAPAGIQARGHLHRHTDPHSRHPGPPTVIPAKAGIYGARSPSPSYRPPQPSFRPSQPSFRRKPESRARGHIHRHSCAPAPGLGCPATIDIPASPFAIIMAWSI